MLFGLNDPLVKRALTKIIPPLREAMFKTIEAKFINETHFPNQQVLDLELLIMLIGLTMFGKIDHLFI